MHLSSIRYNNFSHKSMLYFFISLLLLDYFLSLLLEQLILFLTHLRISQNVILNKMTSFKRSFQNEAFMMLKQSSPLHSSLLPSSFITISVRPDHLTCLMIASILELPLICKLAWNYQFTLTLLSIFIPVTLYK